MLGEGAYGKVYKCKHKQLGQDYAVKCVQKKDMDEDMARQMLSELEILGSFHHPNVMQVKELREDDKNFYIATELCEGGELFDRLVDIGPFSEKNASLVAKQILSAINAMHRQDMVHRDLKPENVLLDFKDKDKFDIKVIDFGFACLYDPKKDAGMDTYLGTPAYMAPEICNYQTYTEKVDVWAFGVIIFMLLSGQMMFAGNNPKATRKLVLQGSV